MARNIVSIVTAVLLQVACSSVSRDFEGEIQLEVGIDDADSRFESSVIYSLKDDPNFAANLDNVDRGDIAKITLELLAVSSRNGAYQVDGQVDVRPVGGDESSWIRGIGRFNRVPLYRSDPVTGGRGEPAVNPPQRVTLELDNAVLGSLTTLIFQRKPDALEVRVLGVGRDEQGTEAGPVRIMFEIEVVVRGSGSL